MSRSLTFACDCGYVSRRSRNFHVCVGTPCADCGEPMRPQHTKPADFPGTREHKGNGVCNRCARRRRYGRTGQTILDGRARKIPADDLLDDWVLLRDDGYSVRDAAPRIGTTPGALDKALYRARRRGDQRGSVVPFAHDMRSHA